MSITAGMQWPPPALAKVQARTAEAQVWWVGDTAELNAFYNRGNTTRPANPGRLRRAWNGFWGREQANPTQPLKKLHVPIAADITALSASELFSEPLTILAAEGDGKDVQDLADLLFNTPTFHSDLFAAGEACSALGGVYGRVVWDQEIGNAWIDFVDADKAIPEFRWGRLSAVTFWTELDGSDDRTVWRHLERHEAGKIVHQVFEGTPSNLGKLKALADHPSTADLTVDVDDYVLTGIEELTAAYVPNVTPNPEWRNDPLLRNLGRADLSTDVFPLMDQLDEVYSSLMRDYRIGKARMYASEELLRSNGTGGGLTLPEDQEMFTRVGVSNKDGDMSTLFEFHQPSIRVVEHSQGSEMLVREILRRTGYSPISFGMPDEVAQTATEATGKAKLTLTTTQGKARHFEAALAPLTTACMRVHAAKFGGTSPTEQLEVEWPQFARESDLSKAQTVQGWETAKAASTRTKVAYLHPDWDEEKVDAEVEEIKGDAPAIPDPSSFFPTDGGGDPNPPADESDADPQETEEE